MRVKTMIASSVTISRNVMTTSDGVVIHRGLFVGIIFFLPLASILAILLVFVRTEPYTIENDVPGSILVM